MRYYIDCEFDGHGGPLLSIAMVREDGSSIHVRTIASLDDVGDPWVAANVIPIMNEHHAAIDLLSLAYEVGPILRRFMGDTQEPIIIADSPVDIGRFCMALSTDDAGNWASTDYPRLTFEVHNVDCYPTDLEGAVQHNAWWDAMALRHKMESSQ